MRIVSLMLATVVCCWQAAAGPVDVEITFSSPGVGISGTLRYAAILQGKTLVAEKELPPSLPSWKLRLEPGEYTVVCGAERFANKSMRLLLQDGKPQRLDCALLPLVPVKGRLLAKRDGRPIVGGKVEPSFLALRELPFESQLLEKHLRLKHQGVSDRQGRFTLGFLPGDTVTLVATAPEHAFKVIGPLVVSSKGVELGDVALEGGASVRVRVEPWGQGFAQGTWWVELVPSRESQDHAPSHVDPQSVSMALLSSPLAENGEVLFESVPAGTYTALLSTLPETLLRRSGWAIPQGMTYRPSHSTRPFVVAPSSFQEVVLAPTRWDVRVKVSGLNPAGCSNFEPWAFSSVFNYSVPGSWRSSSACEFEVLLEASGPWVLGLRRR